MIKLLLDMGLPLRAAADLRAESWDVWHVSERLLKTAPDLDIIELARREGRVIVTLDSDFVYLIVTKSLPGPSVIHVRMQGVTRALTVKLLRWLIPQIAEDLEQGCIASVNQDHVRTRRLPVK